MSVRRPLIVLVGPTGSGKTETALLLIKRFPLEIVSADSRQVYRYMDIGTGKPACKMDYHLIDVVEPDEDFTVADYKLAAEKIIGEIWRRNRIPMLVGGSGLYVQAVVDGLCPAPKADPGIRHRLQEEAKRFGNEVMYRRLERIDPDAAKRIYPHDLRRIIRALEVYELTGIPLSHFQKRTEKPCYSLLMLGIRYSREKLYGMINARVDHMFRQGLVEEVKALMERGLDPSMNSMQGLGYKEVAGYLKGSYGLEETQSLVRRNTRRYAKRQITWFRRDRRIHWIDADGLDIPGIAEALGAYIDGFIREKHNNVSPGTEKKEEGECCQSTSNSF